MTETELKKEPQKTIKKVLLAFSGGLDTTAIIPWIQDTYSAEVIAYCADLGNSPDKEWLENWSKKLGAIEFIFDDLKDQFAHEYAFAAVRAGATYQQDYLLGTAIARPLIAYQMAEWAKKLGVDAIAHGATGKGNDQLRFEKSWAYLVPDIEIIAPWKIWNFTGRKDLAEYLSSKGIEMEAKEKRYSVDVNLFHRSCEGGILELIESDYNKDEVLEWVTPIEKVTPEFYTIDLGFEHGLVTSLNGKKMSAAEILTDLNEIGGKCGIGALDLLEERNIGIKSRGIYETPGGTVLHFATKAMKGLCWSRALRETADGLGQKLGELIYDGHWHTDAADGILNFFEHSAKSLSGTIQLKVGMGQMKVSSRHSQMGLYDSEAVSFESDQDDFNKIASGYCKMSSLGQKIQGQRAKKNEGIK